MMNPFTPGDSTSLDATDTTGSVALPTSGGMQVLIFAPAANDVAFIAFGGSTVVATTADIAVPPGFNRIFTIPPGVTHVAAICDSTETASLFFTCGDGE